MLCLFDHTHKKHPGMQKKKKKRHRLTVFSVSFENYFNGKDTDHSG